MPQLVFQVLSDLLLLGLLCVLALIAFRFQHVLIRFLLLLVLPKFFVLLIGVPSQAHTV